MRSASLNFYDKVEPKILMLAVVTHFGVSILVRALRFTKSFIRRLRSRNDPFVISVIEMRRRLGSAADSLNYGAKF